MKNLSLVAITLTLLSGCWEKKAPTPLPAPTPQPTTRPVPVNPVEPSKPIENDNIEEYAKPRWETIKGKSSWTAMAHEELKAHGDFLLKGEVLDINTFCKATCKASRLDMITYLLSLMVEKESYFREKLEYKENFKDAKGRNVISTGLFQLSIESSQQKRYSCGFTKQSDLYDARGNIRCAIKILNSLSKENGRIKGFIAGKWQGGSRYWSVLRTTRPDAYNFIMNKMRETY